MVETEASYQHPDRGGVWEPHSTNTMYPKSILLRSPCSTKSPGVYELARTQYDFGRSTTPKKEDAIWDDRFQQELVSPVQALLREMRLGVEERSEPVVPLLFSAIAYL